MNNEAFLINYGLKYINNEALGMDYATKIQYTPCFYIRDT